jgi:protein TonB
MLFLAALAHGIIILGITFTAAPLEDDDAPPVLKVTLAVDNGRATPDSDAEWLAQHNSKAAGSAADGQRPTTALAADQPLTREADPLGADARDAATRNTVASPEQLVARPTTEPDLHALPDDPQPQASVPMKAAALLANPVAETRAAEIDLQAQLPQEERSDRELIASPGTRESNLAAYLEEWRQRVERIGTINFPDQARNPKATGRPTLEVAIRADGRLQDVIIRRSSGDPAIDHAALQILRIASPFPPLPESIRANYDVLRFAYEWDFLSGATTPAAREQANADRSR